METASKEQVRTLMGALDSLNCTAENFADLVRESDVMVKKLTRTQSIPPDLNDHHKETKLLVNEKESDIIDLLYRVNEVFQKCINATGANVHRVSKMIE